MLYLERDYLKDGRDYIIKINDLEKKINEYRKLEENSEKYIEIAKYDAYPDYVRTIVGFYDNFLTMNDDNIIEINKLEEKIKEYKKINGANANGRWNGASSNFYKRLGVTQNATSREITKVYRMLSLKYHPNKSSAPNVT